MKSVAFVTALLWHPSAQTRQGRRDPGHYPPTANQESLSNASIQSSQPQGRVVGLGYVGLPLAVEFGKRFNTVGFDIKGRPRRRAAQGRPRQHPRDWTEEELASKRPSSATRPGSRTSSPAACSSSRCRRRSTSTSARDLTPLVKSERVGGQGAEEGRRGGLRVHRVPGLHRGESACRSSSASRGSSSTRTFFAGYSPERINPGDKQHRLTTIKQGHLGLDAGGGGLR